MQASIPFTKAIALPPNNTRYMKVRLIAILAGCFFTSSAIAQVNPFNGKEGSLTVKAEPAIDNLVEQYKELNIRNPKITGYRVQIYNGRKAESQAKKTAFLSEFPSTPVYHIYEAPEYKVQVGNFRSRLEAEKFLKRVIDEFGSGFVVKTKIQPPALYYPVKQ